MMNYSSKHTSLTAWQRVLHRLWTAKTWHEQYYPLPEIGFLPVYELQKLNIGGSSGDRRLRDLRLLFNVPIEYRVFKIGDRRIHAYRLDCDPNEIDWNEIVEQGANWRFRGSKIKQMELI